MKTIYKTTLIIVIVLAITAVLFLWFLPASKESRRILKEIDEKSREKTMLEKEINDLLLLRSDYFLLNALFEKYKTEVPLSDGITVLTDQIYEIGKYSGIKIQGIDFKEIDETRTKSNEKNKTGIINVSTVVTGSYYQVLTFLNTIEIMPRLIKVENISLNLAGVFDDESTDEDVFDLSALINFKTFYDKTDYSDNR